MASCVMLVPSFPVPTFRTRIIYSPPVISKSTLDNIFPESINGFKFGLIGRLFFEEGEESLPIKDVCRCLHSSWNPRSTWRLTPMGHDDYYLLQFSCLEDQLKVSSLRSYSLKGGRMEIEGMLSPNYHVNKKLLPGPSITLVRWHPPLPFWIKVNTDGSARGCPGPSSCGGVFRDHKGNVVGCFSTKLDVGIAFEAELQACIGALDIAHDRGWNRLWLESDSTEVVELLYSRSTNVPTKFKGWWMRVLSYLEHMEFRVSHIYREGNRVADALANSDTESGWWPCEIPSISKLVEEDRIGYFNARFRFR